MTSAAWTQLATVAEAARIPAVSVAGCWSWPPSPMTFGLPSPRPLTVASSCRRVGRCQPGVPRHPYGARRIADSLGISAWEDSPRNRPPTNPGTERGKGKTRLRY
jgi:hypothetical protein